MALETVPVVISQMSSVASYKSCIVCIKYFNVDWYILGIHNDLIHLRKFVPVQTIS